ncbi:MAG: transposase [Blastochloris sp.]|nr:transposase [Blastochloris sp.]
MLDQGKSQAEVARHFKVSQASVSRWAAQWRRQGLKGLRSQHPAHAPSRLSLPQQQEVIRGLQAGAQKWGWRDNFWTLARIAQMIQKLSGVSYHEAHVWRLLQSWGWSCQRPVGRVSQRNEKAIARWKTKTWPEIKKKPALRGG